MPAEICAIMQLRRDHIRRQGCGSPHISGTFPMDVSGGAANFAEDGAWNRFKLLRAVVVFPAAVVHCVLYIIGMQRITVSNTQSVVEHETYETMQPLVAGIYIYIYIYSIG